jgi:hypothetical protein
MWKRLAPGLLLLAAAACGGDSSGPGDTSADSGPAQVIVAEGTASSSDIYRQSMTLHLRNEGGPGVYKLDVWASQLRRMAPSLGYRGCPGGSCR